MKKVSLLLSLLFLATITVSAQEDMVFLRYAKPDYIIIKNYIEGVPTGEQYKITLDYKDNNSIHYGSYEWENGEWMKTSIITEQEYNSDMLVIRESYYIEQGDQPEIVEEYRFEYDLEYDEQDRLNEYLFRYENNGSGIWYTSPGLSTIEYNEKGMRTSAVIYSLVVFLMNRKKILKTIKPSINTMTMII